MNWTAIDFWWFTARAAASVRATSLLKRAGFRDIANLTGGFDAWKATGFTFVLPGSE